MEITAIHVPGIRRNEILQFSGIFIRPTIE
jgi:hypothetical protein